MKAPTKQLSILKEINQMNLIQYKKVNLQIVNEYRITKMNSKRKMVKKTKTYHKNRNKIAQKQIQNIYQTRE